MILVHFQGRPFNITVIQVYAPTTNAEEGEVKWFYEDLQDFLGLTNTKKKKKKKKQQKKMREISFKSQGNGMQK